MGLFDWFFRGRQQLLHSDEPERAFAPDPSDDVFQLATRATNEQAFAQIDVRRVTVLRVSSEEAVTLSAFPPGVLIFATVSETYAAKTIGPVKRTIDAGRVEPLAI